MLKKAGFVAATAAGLLMIGGTAVAEPASTETDAAGSGGVTYEQAYEDFIISGGQLGSGAAGLVASAYTGVALTPALVAGSLSH